MFVAMREVASSLDQVRGGQMVTLASGTRLRHVRTECAAECIPAIEYADVFCDVLDGQHAGRRAVFLTFVMNAPVPERELLEADYGIVGLDDDGRPRPLLGLASSPVR